MVAASPGSSGSVASPTLRILPSRDTSAPSALALERAEHVLRPDELVPEDAAGDLEQVSHQRITQGVANRNPLLACRHHVVRPQHREMLGDAGLIETQKGLQFLDGAVALHQELDQPDADGMREGLEESRLERL